MVRPNRLFTFVFKYPRLILTMSLLLSVFSAFYTYRNMTFLTGRDDLMPRNAPFQVDYRAYRAEFGDQEEIVAVIESDDAAKTTRAADALYARLTRDNELFIDVFHPGALQLFRSNGLLFMPLDEIRGLRNTMKMAAPVLQELAKAPSVQTLFMSLTGQIDSYLAAAPPSPGASDTSLESLLFMLSTLNHGFKTFDGKGGGMSIDSFLKGQGTGAPSMLETAGRQQVITMLPHKSPGSFINSERSITAARAAMDDVLGRAEFKGVKGGLTGIPVLEYEEMTSSQRDMGIATILSLTLTVILLLVAFRGLFNVFAAMTALLVGICLSFGFATMTVGHLNILSMAFAIMLIGLGIEYGIQVVLRYQEEIKSENGELTAIETALATTFRSVTIAAATVALAFATFALTDFKGIAELGIIAAGGILFCVISTFTVLPAMLVLLGRFRRDTPIAHVSPLKTRSSSFLRLLSDRPGSIIMATFALSVLCINPAVTARFDYNLMNLQARGLQSVEYAYKLMRSRENSGYFAVVTARDIDEARHLSEKLENLPTVDHVISILSFVPTQQPEKLAEIAALKSVMDGIRPVPYDENLQLMALPAVFENFRTRVEMLKSELARRKAPAAVPVGDFLTTLDQFFAKLEKEKDRNAVAMLKEFQGGMFAELPEKLTLLKESLTATEIGTGDIPPELRRRFTGRSGSLLLQVAAKKEIFEREPLHEFVQQVKRVAPHVTGEPVMVYESLSILRDAYVRAFVYAFAGIAALLLITFRSIRYTLLGLIPLSAGLLLMVGGMKLAGISFNSANIIVLPLILGVGIDSAIYILIRYRQGDETPLQVITSSAGIGVLLNALTILFSFGALMVARHQGVFSIGAVMSLGMAATVAAFLIFLPALLMLWGKR